MSVSRIVAMAALLAGCGSTERAIDSAHQASPIQVYTWPVPADTKSDVWANCKPGFVVQAAQCFTSRDTKTWSGVEDAGATYRCGAIEKAPEPMTLTAVLECIEVSS